MNLKVTHRFRYTASLTQSGQLKASLTEGRIIIRNVYSLVKWRILKWMKLYPFGFSKLTLPTDSTVDSLLLMPECCCKCRAHTGCVYTPAVTVCIYENSLPACAIKNKSVGKEGCQPLSLTFMAIRGPLEGHPLLLMS